MTKLELLEKMVMAQSNRVIDTIHNCILFLGSKNDLHVLRRLFEGGPGMILAVNPMARPLHICI